MFEKVLRKVITDERLKNIPILYITQILIALEDMDLLKGEENETE